MAGIGVRLNRIFEKRTLTTNMVGFGYSAMVTIAPMIVVIGCLVLMEYLLIILADRQIQHGIKYKNETDISTESAKYIGN